MTRVVTSIAEVRAAVTEARQERRLVGVVPTMGALHEGHARLVEVCREECGGGLVIVTIFVNPTQFGPGEDYDRYPRTLDTDRVVCERAGADLIFAPNAPTMYPHGLENATFVEVPELSRRFEGASRPGHFRGVATVVTKLLTITQPDLAFFGAKDFQQQAVIRRMVDDLNLPVTIRTVATVRDHDGLALSSRNRYLDPDERRGATVLYRSLEAARAAVAGGLSDANRVRQILTETVQSEQRAVLDYAEVADAETLEPLTQITQGRPAVALLAVRFGTTRLIDNALLPG